MSEVVSGAKVTVRFSGWLAQSVFERGGPVSAVVKEDLERFYVLLDSELAQLSFVAGELDGLVESYRVAAARRVVVGDGRLPAGDALWHLRDDGRSRAANLAVVDLIERILVVQRLHPELGVDRIASEVFGVRVSVPRAKRAKRAVPVKARAKSGPAKKLAV